MKFLLVAENNSLSHVAKCLAIEDHLAGLGHETLVAVSGKSARFVRGLGRNCTVLPDLQENDDSGFPTVHWFNRPAKIAECINAERALLEQFRPDRALGVFRFTLQASAQLAGIPFDSLTCGCMHPGSDEVLGFAPGEHGSETQQQNLELFFRFAGAKMSAVLRDFGLAPVDDIRQMLQGERTFLWDFPEFTPVAKDRSLHHIGPLTWGDWPHDTLDLDELATGSGPLAVVSFGTCVNSAEIADRIVRMLLQMGYRVLLAAGGQEPLLKTPRHPRVTVCRFAPLKLIFPHASLLVCHGGQMTVFEALAQHVPVLVMPFQPEQAHNGVSLERLNCGRRLVPAQQFRGNSGVYLDAFNSMSDATFRGLVEECTHTVRRSGSLESTRGIIGRFQALETLGRHLAS